MGGAGCAIPIYILSDNCNDNEEIARISGFCWASEIDIPRLVRPRNVSVDLK